MPKCPEKDCPNCKNWRFDRQTHFCIKGHSPTYTSIDMSRNRILGLTSKCSDMKKLG